MNENTLGIVGGVRSGRRHWSLVITSERILVATVGKAGLGAAFEVGGILMAKSRARKRTEGLAHQTPERTLAAHRLNYAISLSNIRNARMDDPDVVTTGTLDVETEEGTRSFTLTDEDAYREHADLLRTALGDTLQFD